MKPAPAAPRTPASPVEVRKGLADALHLDLIGPRPEDSLYQEEILDVPPSQYYLGGFLVPSTLEPSARGDAEAADDLGNTVAKEEGGEDSDPPEAAAQAHKSYFPSSMGLSFLCPRQATTLFVEVTFGDYVPLKRDDSKADDRDDNNPKEEKARPKEWQRIPRSYPLTVSLTQPHNSYALPESGGMVVEVSLREVPKDTPVPQGCRAVSLFLVNRRPSAPVQKRDQAYVFQAALQVHCDQGFEPRPDQRSGDDFDDQVSDLQYRDVAEFAVGHNVSACSIRGIDQRDTQRDTQRVLKIATTFIPSARVEKVVPSAVPDVVLNMETLANAQSGAEVRELLKGLVPAYQAWIKQQPLPGASLNEGRYLQTAQSLLHDAEIANQRLEAGLLLLDDPDVLFCFCKANLAIARALRQRRCHGTKENPQTVQAPTWYPFQLAFLLLNLTALVHPESNDRRTVDLLFFPTGGGKTEAYLGLAAFTLLFRRIKNADRLGAGVSVLMRYTLRLLTLDQLGRAATLVCALELLRREDPKKLGTWPFEIGLFVGRGATPNRMGKKGVVDPDSARERTHNYKKDEKRYRAPLPVRSCPWCGETLSPHSFQLLPTPDKPLDLRLKCPRRGCAFDGSKCFLPIVAVDEAIYRRLPGFLIATVDKFAALPWVGQVGALLGRVERYDSEGFYGAADPGIGKPLPGGRLLPPDLIIQDELHLISGPLGSMAGLYEAALDALCAPKITTGHLEGVRPKIVASTATVRRAERQIRALFGRDTVRIFPPPGPDRRDSFFAHTASEENPRLYLGVACPGRSLKLALMRSYLALLTAAKRAYDQAGGDKNPNNPADPYMTLLGYFNSLRELGGSRRIVEDEITDRSRDYDRRHRVGERSGLFEKRTIEMPEELTSRVSTDQVSKTKEKLALPFSAKGRVDVALATNMISVGLDITRLGLMVVLGQPKTTSEYIQTTSRVGRDSNRPGLVITLLNVHRPRDRSHYERFETFHNSFYRAVEATSVTPFSPRAVDRGLPAVVVALSRHGLANLTKSENALAIVNHREALAYVGEILGRRAEEHQALPANEAEALRKTLKTRATTLLDTWANLAEEQHKHGGGLQYGTEIGAMPPLLWEPSDPQLTKQEPKARRFKAGRSLRDVEPSVNLWVRTPSGNLASDGDDDLEDPS